LTGSRWWSPMGVPMGNLLPRTRLVASPSIASLDLPLAHGSRELDTRSNVINMLSKVLWNVVPENKLASAVHGLCF
jgi:hypothetical protein